MNTQKISKNYILIAIGAFLFGFSVNTHSNQEVQCAIYFSPGQPCAKKIIERITNAKNEILVQSFSFTSIDIANALILAHKRGVKVVCIFDSSQEKKVLIHKLAQEGISVFIDKPAGIAHNKVMTIHDIIVLTGSYNFTNAAEHRNVENSIHFENPQIANEYKEQWKKRLAISKKMDKDNHFYNNNLRG